MRREIEGLLTIIVPRHPERGNGLAATLGGLWLFSVFILSRRVKTLDRLK